MKTKKIAVLIAVLISLIAGILLIKANLIRDAKDYYTYTKAICNENNFCQDHIITCENKKIISVNPITGASIQHSNTWKDPRENKSEILCK